MLSSRRWPRQENDRALLTDHHLAGVLGANVTTVTSLTGSKFDQAGPPLALTVDYGHADLAGP